MAAVMMSFLKSVASEGSDCTAVVAKSSTRAVGGLCSRSIWFLRVFILWHNSSLPVSAHTVPEIALEMVR